MPDPRRVWNEDDIAKLKEMAGRIPREEIAAQLGRTVGATAVEASKLGLSLRCSKRLTAGDQGASAPTNP
jgi:hypothetical protein